MCTPPIPTYAVSGAQTSHKCERLDVLIDKHQAAVLLYLLY